MATQNLTNADAILKDLYVGPIVEQLNQKTFLLDQLQRDSDHIDHTGRRAVVPVHKNRNRSQVSQGDGGTLPTAGRQDWEDAIIPIRYHYAGIELTDTSIEATKSNEGAFISLLEAESKGVAQDLKKDMNRMAFGDGTGLLASIASSSSSSTLNVDSVQYLHVGDVVDVVKKADGTVSTNGVTNAVITARNVSAKTVTISPGLGGTVDSNYGVYHSGGVSGSTTAGGSYGNEMDGLRNICSDQGILHGINRGTAGNEFWKANVRAANGVIGESLIEQLFDDIGENGRGEVDVALTTRGIRRQLADSYQSQKRFTDGQAVTVHGGYRAILVNEVPVIVDDDCPKGYFFAFKKEVLKWFEQTKPGWLESNDGTIFQLKHTANAGQRQAIWQAWFRWYVALGCVRPNLTGALTGGTDDLPSVVE